MPTLFLDGGFAGAQLPGDLFVEQTGDGGGHHVLLARSQQVIPTTKLGELQPLRACDAITIDRVANGVEQVLLAKRLRQKLDGTGLHGFHDVNDDEVKVGRARVVARLVPHLGPTNGYRVDWDGFSVAYISDHQAPRDLDSVPDSVLALADGVEQEASRSMPSGAAQERLSAREDFHGQPHGREQSSEGIAKGPVIVDDEDDRALEAHRISGSAKRNVAPWFTFAVAHSRPLCASMIERLIERPIPSPPGFVV